MPANSRWDLIRRLRVKALQYTDVCLEALGKTKTESKPRFEPEIPEIEEVAVLTP